ncbi:uncharacterized protein RHO17_014845 [Thomomys bottae]
MSEDSSLTKVVVHSDEDIKGGDTSTYTTTKLDETNNNEGDDTTLTAIAVCESSINICLDKNDPTEFGTEEFKQSDILSDTSTELDKGTNNEGDDTALTAIAVCDPSINICLDKNDPPDLGTEEFKQSKDSNLTTVVVHSNEDISTATTAHDPCPAPDDGNVTESKTEVETKRVPTSGLPFKIDILSDTTTKRDELNNNEGNHMKKIANKILLSLSFRILAILLIFVDLGLMVTDIIVTTSKLHIPLEYRTISLLIAIFFLLDVVLQVFVTR